jgi:hypothetical protein
MLQMNLIRQEELYKGLYGELYAGLYMELDGDLYWKLYWGFNGELYWALRSQILTDFSHSKISRV